MKRKREPFEDDGHTIVDMSELPARSFLGLQRLKKRDVYTDAQGNPRRRRTFSGLELLLIAVVVFLILCGIAALVIWLV